MRLARQLQFGLALALLLPASSRAGRLPPTTYPLVFQTMKSRLEPSDFARMGQYDVLEVGLWALQSSNDNLDSLLALRERRPEQVILLALSSTMTCSNWNHEEVYHRAEWGDTVAAHAEEWLLRDTDGDLYLMADVESTCAEGRLNYYSTEMAVAFAHYVAEASVLRYPDLLDGIRIDDLQDNVYWMNSLEWLQPPELDSIDANRDGQADTYQELGGWWSAGVDTFLATLRGIVGPDVILLDNGYLPIESFHWINGRYHEGYPHEHGDGWEKAMTDPRKGYLGGDTLYSDVPVRLTGLLTYNASAGYNYDPYHLSTKDAPYPHPGFPGFLRFSLASYLLGEGWYGMTGWGNSVDWKGDPIPCQYQTLWWFPVYDTLKTYLGTPTGKAVRDMDEWHRDRFQRDFTGGRTRVFPGLKKGILDLDPIAGPLDPIPAIVRSGVPVPIAFSLFDPNGSNERLATEIRLSRNGGATFPEVIATGDNADTLVTWIPSGTGVSCMLQVSATDTSDLVGTVRSGLFRINPSPAPDGGLAEIRPSSWIANMPSLLCTLTVYTPSGGASSGWNRIAVVFPEPVHMLSFAGAEGESGALASTTHVTGDTLFVELAERRTPPARVRLRFIVSAPSPTGGDPLTFAAGVNDSENPGPWITLDPGDANNNAGDGNTLSVTCTYGPPVDLAIEPEAIEIAAGDTARFALSGSDAAGNAVEVAPSWSVSDTLGSVDSAGLFLARRSGSLLVTATVGGLSASASVTVAPGEPDSLHVVPKNTSVTVGDSIHYTCSVHDAWGNPVPDAVVVWSAGGGVGSIDPSGWFVATGAGSGTVRAVSGAALDSASVLVTNAPFIDAFVRPQDPTVSADSLVPCTLFAVSAAGDTAPIAGDWLVRGESGSIDEEGIFSPALAGTVVIVGSCAFGVDSTTATVLPGAPYVLLVEPDSAEIAAGETLAVGATLFDRHGNPAPDTASLEAEGACAGPIDSFFMCESLGEARVVGAFGALRDTAFVRVRAAAASAIAVSPDFAECVVGDSLVFSALVSDPFGNPVDSEVVWEASGSAGAVDPTGLFLAAAPGSGQVIARSGPLADSAVVLVSSSGETDTSATDTTVVDTTVTDTTATDTTDTDTTVTDTTVTDTTVTDTTETDTTAEGTLTVQAIDGDYDPLLWPTPLVLACAFRDSSGDPIEPEPDDTFLIHLRLLDESLAACDPPIVRMLRGELPDTVSLSVEGIGGCGAIDIRVEGPGGIRSEPDTLFFSSPDVNADLFIDLGDVAALLAEKGGIGAGLCTDLDGVPSIGMHDLDVVVSAYEAGCAGEAASGLLGVAPPEWYALGDAVIPCQGETTAARFSLEPGRVDSLVAVEVSFPTAGPWDHPVTWIPSSVWRAPVVYELPEGPDGPRVLIVETDGVVVPNGGGLLEARVCGAATDAFAGGKSYARIIGPDFTASVRFEAPVRFLLDIEEPEDPGDTTDSNTPLGYVLLPTRPNPFHGSATIRFAVPSPGGVIRLDVYNVRGECVRVIEEGVVGAGSHALEWSGDDYRGRGLPPGAYFVRMQAGGRVLTKKLILLP